MCWEHRILKPYGLSLKEFSRYDKRTKKTLACFNEFYNQFYFDKKKRVPVKIRNLLCDPLALAVWYLDDGALRVDSKAFRLHTNSYPLCDVLLLKEVLL